MEFNCPQCGKRLRAPDHLPNPLVRCRTCGAAFRPREEAEQPVKAQVVGPAPPTPPFRSAAPRPLSSPPTAPSPTSTSPPVPSEVGQTVAKGLGVVVVLIFLLISKAPQLLKGVFGDRQPPAPVQMPDKDARAIRELLEEARQKPPLQPIPLPAKKPNDPDLLPLSPLSDGPIDPQAEPPE